MAGELWLKLSLQGALERESPVLGKHGCASCHKAVFNFSGHVVRTDLNSCLAIDQSIDSG